MRRDYKSHRTGQGETLPRQTAGRVLIVDDEPSVLSALTHVLSKLGHKIVTASTGTIGLCCVKDHGPFDLVLLDMHLPELDGVELLMKIRKLDPELSVVIMTGYASVSTAVKCLKAGAFDYLTKPFTDIFDVCTELVQDGIYATSERREEMLVQISEAPTEEHRAQSANKRWVGKYGLEKLLGSGGMGEIWLSHHPTLHCPVAVKLLRHGVVEHDIAVARFEQEVEMVTVLKHPNTVRVLDCGATDDGTHYFVMEHLEGEDLCSRVLDRGPMDPLQVIKYARQVCGGLLEAHQAGIIHRDIKPENIFIAGEGQREMIKILDFGIARFADRTSVLTGGAPWIGTPAYLAPELLSGRKGGISSDLYALGGVMFFMLTARAPFEGKHVAAVLQHHLNTPPRRPRDVVKTPIPPALEKIVLRCLAKNPKERYPNVLWLDQALQRAVGPCMAYMKRHM